jgi:NADH dehydrogenase FAD-containing subunit
MRWRADSGAVVREAETGTMSGHRVLILGAGFGGLEAAKSLACAPVEVTLVDRQNHHCFQPLLYQVATATLSPADIAWPIRSILSRQPNLKVLMAEVSGIDSARRVVHSSGGDFTYDQLVVATGATHGYFGHHDWAPLLSPNAATARLSSFRECCRRRPRRRSAVAARDCQTPSTASAESTWRDALRH